MVDYLPSASRMTTKLNQYYHRKSNNNNSNNTNHQNTNISSSKNSNNNCMSSCPTTCGTANQTTTTTNKGKTKYQKIFRRVSSSSRNHLKTKKPNHHEFNDDNDNNERGDCNDDDDILITPIVILPPPLSSEVEISTNPFDTVDSGDDHNDGNGDGGVTLVADEQQCDTNPFSRNDDDDDDDDSWDNTNDNNETLGGLLIPATIIPPPIMDVDEKKVITTNPFDDDDQTTPNANQVVTSSTPTTTIENIDNVNNKRIIGATTTDNNHPPPSSEQNKPNDNLDEITSSSSSSSAALTKLSHPKTPLPDILQIITHHPHNPTIQKTGYQRLKHLSRSFSNKQMILSNNDVISILSSTITSPHDETMTVLAFDSLCSLTSRNDSLSHHHTTTTTTMQKINKNTLHLISLLLSTMTRHPTIQSIQSMGCNALLNLTFDCHYLLYLKSLYDDDDDEHLIRRVLRHAAQHYSECALSCRIITERLNFGVSEALDMIYSLQNDNNNEGGGMVMRDVVTLLTIPSLTMSSSVHYAGCVAIDAIMVQEEKKESGGGGGWINEDDDGDGNDYSALSMPSDFAIIHVVTNAMERHGTTTTTMSSLQSLGCVILRRLCHFQRLTKEDNDKRAKPGRRRRQGWENATVVITCNGWELITKGMKRHSKVKEVQKEGCLLMHCLMEATKGKTTSRGDDCNCDNNDGGGGDEELMVNVHEKEMKLTKRVLKAAKKNYPGECGDLVDEILLRLRLRRQRQGRKDDDDDTDADYSSSLSSSHFRVKVF